MKLSFTKSRLDIRRTISQCRNGVEGLTRKVNNLGKNRLFYFFLLVLVWFSCAITGFRLLQTSKKLPFSEFTYPTEMDFITAYKKFKQNGELPPHGNKINPHPFHYIHFKQNCNFESDEVLSLLILVKSAVDNFHLRDGIRATWGKGNGSGGNVQIVFLLAHRPEYQLRIDEEAFAHGDIIQESFIDAYSNNTYKTIMGFKWAVQYCRKASHLLFVDDDHYLVVPNILIYINNLYASNMANLMVGYEYFEAKPFMSTSSKWYITQAEYPFDQYPPYLTAGAYLVSRDVADKLVFSFPYVKYFWIDDVYLGILAHKLGIILQHEPKFYQPSYLLHTEPTHMVYHDFKTKEAFINIEKFVQGFPFVSPSSKMCRYSLRCLASLLL